MDEKTTTAKDNGQSCFQYIMDPSFTVNSDKTITWANDMFFDTFKVKKSDVIGKMAVITSYSIHYTKLYEDAAI